MYVADLRVVKCSKCESINFEHVIQGAAKFMRCRSCGHEGTKSNVLPEMNGGGSTEFKYSADQPVKY